MEKTIKSKETIFKRFLIPSIIMGVLACAIICIGLGVQSFIVSARIANPLEIIGIVLVYYLIFSGLIAFLTVGIGFNITCICLLNKTNLQNKKLFLILNIILMAMGATFIAISVLCMGYDGALISSTVFVGLAIPVIAADSIYNCFYLKTLN